NAALPQDVNGDTRVTANDLLIVINAVLAENRSGAGQAQPLAAGVQMEGNVEYPRYAVDVNADGRLTARDLLVVINYLLDPPAPAQPAAAAPSAAPLAAEAVDEALVLFETDEEDDAEAGAKA